MTLDKRIHFFPSAGLLVTLGEGNDQLVLRRLNIVEAMEKAGLDYLFVSSMPVRAARAARRMRIRSRCFKKGGLQFKLDSGPEEMAVDSKGNLNWAVPGDFKPDSASVIVSVRDSAGQEIYHSFTIRVR